MDSATVGGSVLVVGDASPSRRDPPEDERSSPAFCTFQEVNRALLARAAPAVVISSILTDGFDAQDLAMKLARAGYRGRYIALTKRLPSPDLVRAEIRAACPQLDFDLIVIEQSPARRLI